MTTLSTSVATIGSLVPEIPEWQRLAEWRIWFRNRLRKRDPHCRYCGVLLSRKRATLDHVTPKAQGGQQVPRNMTLCCMPCNRSKGNRTPWQLVCWSFRVYLVSLVVRLKGGAA